MNLGPVRAHAPVIRRALGAAILAVAVLMVYGVDKRLQTRVPEYTRALQALEESAAAQGELEELVGGPGLAEESRLDDFGPAPEFQAIEGWINSDPLTMESLRGKVVLLDFWTYSCINCLRTLPHVKAWDEAYRDDGLVIVGVHTPEFAFEREPDNVRRAVRDHGIEYPVALDSDYGTWQAWLNRYWPAKYFVDRRGHVRYAHFGEGDYEESERVIRLLLAEDADGALVSEDIEDETPTGAQTPESYLGYERIERFTGFRIEPNREAEYAIPEFVPLHGLAYGGRWTVEDERAVAGMERPPPPPFQGEQRLPRPRDERRRPDRRGGARRRAYRHGDGDPGRHLHPGAHPGRKARPHARPRLLAGHGGLRLHVWLGGFGSAGRRRGRGSAPRAPSGNG